MDNLPPRGNKHLNYHLSAHASLLVQLREYTPTDPGEEEMVDQTIDLLLQYPNCLLSTHYEPGHITGSAWITDPEGRMTLLVHHAKLDRWLQPGGHLEPGEDAWSGAYREGCEETGIKKFISHDKEIFDVDVHPIPARGDVPAHLHFDVRFRFIADPAETLVLTEESKGIQWIPLTDVRMWNKEPSIIRLVRKSLLTDVNH